MSPNGAKAALAAIHPRGSVRCDSMMFALMVGDKKLVHNAKAQKGTVLDPRFHISI